MSEMERVKHTVIEYSHGDKWPTALKSAAQAAAEVGITEARLVELTEAGYAPHWVIDGGPPMYRVQDLKAWGAKNIARSFEGRPLPIRLEVKVAPLPATTAPESIRGIPELVEMPMAAQPGVYFLVRGDRVVYVGQSISPLTRIGNHVGNPRKDFDRVFMVPVPQSLLDAVEGALIRWLRPELNGVIPPQRDRDDAGLIQRIFRYAPEHTATQGISA